MEENIDYLKAVTQKISEAKLLSRIPAEKKELAIKLLYKKKLIQEKNGLLAEIQLKRINKKIERLTK